MIASTELRPWRSLTTDAQTDLRRTYQNEIATQPLTCSMDEKMNRFTAWLAERGVSFTVEDLKRRG